MLYGDEGQKKNVEVFNKRIKTLILKRISDYFEPKSREANTRGEMEKRLI